MWLWIWYLVIIVKFDMFAATVISCDFVDCCNLFYMKIKNTERQKEKKKKKKKNLPVPIFQSPHPKVGSLMVYVSFMTHSGAVCVQIMLSEHIWFRKFFQIIYSPGPRRPYDHKSRPKSQKSKGPGGDMGQPIGRKCQHCEGPKQWEGSGK